MPDGSVFCQACGHKMVSDTNQHSQIQHEQKNLSPTSLKVADSSSQLLNHLNYLFRKSNVHKESMVVAYDDQMAGSARLWFLLKYMGHDNVSILDGGIQEWVRAGFNLSTEVPPPGNGDIIPKINSEIIASLDEVKNLEGRKLIDCRERIRYRGIEEPIDRKAGHIPNAINIPYSDLLSNNHYIEDTKIKNIFKEIPEGSIVYCGSGVTSCVNLFAMEKIGLNPKVYVGSWSDWISYDENEIARE